MPPSAVKTAETGQPLTQPEREQLDQLLARASAGQAPGARIGSPYIALINLSVPRREILRPGDHPQSDLVMAGETVYLTDEEAARFLRHGPRDGRQVPVIRPAAGPGSSQQMPQRLPPRAVSGRVQAPPPPVPGTDGPRPDPPGSSAVQFAQPADVPETAEPAPGSENASWAGPDTEDIPPRAGRTRR